MPTCPVLHTAQLILLPQTLPAAAALLAGEDPGFPLAAGYPHADTFDALRMSVAEGAAPSGWFVAFRDSATVFGDCGTKGWVDGARRVEIGYGLAPPWRGRGLGTEAVRAMVDWLRAQREVRVVVAEVEVGNVASRRLLERLGFDLAGEVRGAWWFQLSAGRESLDRGEHVGPRA